MKKTAICTSISVFAGAVALCVGAASAQQPGYQPAPPPLQLQQPVQAQPAPQPAAYQPVPPPPPAVQAPPQNADPALTAPAQGQTAVKTGGAGIGKPAAPKSGVIDAESSMRLGVELSVEALAAAPYLHYDNGRKPGSGKVAPPKDRDVYQRFDKVIVKPVMKIGLRHDPKIQKGDKAVKEPPFKVGDTVDVLRSIKTVKVGGKSARLVARTARGVVLGFAGKKAIVLLTDMWGKVSGSERVARAEPFLPVYIDVKPAADAENIKASVVLRVDKSIVLYLHQYIVVNKGSEAGVKVGDFFKVTDRERPGRFSEELAEAQAINVTAKASTLVLQKVYSERLRRWDEADLSFRAAEKK